jgi:integrase
MGRGRQGNGIEVHRGKLRVRFTVNGKRYVESLELKATAPNIKAAGRIAADVRDKIRLGVFDYAVVFPNSKNVPTKKPQEAAQTLRQYADIWLKTLTGEKSTLYGYRTSIDNFWLTVVVATEKDTATGEDKDIQLGDLALAAVRHTHIATAIASKANSGATGKTTNNLLIPIRALFSAAVADEKIETSPVAKVHNRKHQRKQIDPFIRDEMDAIIRRFSERGPAVIHNYYQFAFATGMRTSELIALRWGDIDWVRKIAHVSRAQVRHVQKDTKTHQARDVDLNGLALAALYAQKSHTFMKGINEQIFCSPEGEPWLSERRLREDFFQPCLKALGFRQRPAYNTRHTFATVALMAGVNPAYIAGQLGHANTAMLFKHYAKWIQGSDSGIEAGKLSAVFDPKNGRIGPKLAPDETEAIKSKDLMAGATGLEPATFGVTGRHSNQLSYAPAGRSPKGNARRGPMYGREPTLSSS